MAANSMITLRSETRPDHTSDVATDRAGLLGLLDRAAADPALLAMMSSNVIASAFAAGVQLSGADLKCLLGITGATDSELVDVLKARLARVPGADCGCGS